MERNQRDNPARLLACCRDVGTDAVVRSACPWRLIQSASLCQVDDALSHGAGVSAQV